MWSRRQLAAWPLGLLMTLAAAAGAPPARAAAAGWQIVGTFPGAGGIGTLDYVAVAGPGDAWAAGQNGGGVIPGSLVEHWDGQSWTQVQPPLSVAPTGLELSSPTNVWILGIDRASRFHAERWNGVTWRTFTFPRKVWLTGISVFSAASVWVFGESYGRPATVAFAERWNGTTWTRKKVPGIPAQGADAPSGTSARNLWVPGVTVASLNKSPWRQTYILMHRNARGWHTVKLPRPRLPAGQYLKPGNVLALGSSNVWMIGEISSDSTDYPLRSVLLHWNGSRWHSVRSPVNGLLAMTPDGKGGSGSPRRSSSRPATLWTIEAVPGPCSPPRRRRAT